MYMLSHRRHCSCCQALLSNCCCCCCCCCCCTDDHDDDDDDVLKNYAGKNELSHTTSIAFTSRAPVDAARRSACLYLLTPQLHARCAYLFTRISCSTDAPEQRPASAAFRPSSRGNTTPEITFYLSPGLTLVYRDEPSTALRLLGIAGVVNVCVAPTAGV